jgi:hypothetical protein
MNQRQLASVLFAAIGLFIAASRLPDILVQVAALTSSIPATDPPASPAGQRLVLTFGLISSIVAVLIGTVLIFLGDRLANRLFPSGYEALTSPEVQAVAISVLGCYFAVQGLSRMAWAGYLNWSGVTQLALGVGLFFGARALSKLWSFGRSGGVARSVGESAV